MTNHWLDDLAAKHATVPDSSAGMETRLLGEIARLQARIEALENGLKYAERLTPRTPISVLSSRFSDEASRLYRVGKIIREMLES